MNENTRRFLASLFFVLVLLSTVTACSNRNVDLAKAAVEKELIDPSSVQYRNVVAYSENVVCGEVNSKNRLGGYVGFKPFVYREGTVALDASIVDTHSWCNDETQKHLAYMRTNLAIQESICADKSLGNLRECKKAEDQREAMKAAEKSAQPK